MRKTLAITLASALLLAVLAVSPASAAGGRGWERRGEWGGRHEVHNGCVGCGFLGGLLLGGVLGGALAAPYVAPPPVVYSAPPPTCYSQPGYWGRVPYVRPDGYTDYRDVWVPGQTVCQ
jgi:hypothetical protein